jgi:uridine kinase
MPPRVVVGIAGGSASGKSVLASALAAALQRLHQRRVLILATDRYMHKDRSLGPTFFSQATGTHMFDANHPDAIAWNDLLRDLTTSSSKQRDRRSSSLKAICCSTNRPYVSAWIFVSLSN